MANGSPGLVRRAYNDGHTIGTHSQNHPMNIPSLPIERSERDIEDGIASVTKALGGAAAPAPFFRFPGFGRTPATEQYLESQRIMIWSTDVLAGDWNRISPEQVIERSLARLKRKGKGILLLHDIQQRTVEALPKLLDELKSAGFRLVHVVPAGPDRPKTATAPAQWIFRAGKTNVDPSSPMQ
jgi:peptidoglycan/xylan/chitin deacetylase (PgdA/CDA1 family)